MSVIRLAYWWYEQYHRMIAVVGVAVGSVVIGLGVAQAVPITTVQATRTNTLTLHQTRVLTHTKMITVRIRGRVIRRHDHILVVLVPRTVFRTRTVPRHRIVVPRHVVRIHEPPPIFGATSAVTVLGVAPAPQTATVTETIPMPYPVPGPTTTVTDVQTVTETTPPVTITVTIPGGFSGQQEGATSANNP